MTWRSGQAQSQDLRERVLASVDGGLRVREVAPLFQVSIFFYMALARRGATGATTPLARGGAQHKAVVAGHEAALLAHLLAKPDATLGELRRWLFETRSVSISVGPLWNGLHRLGWTRKRRSQHAAERSDVAAARAEWHVAQHGLNPTRLIFLDESGFSTNMTRRQERSPRGEPLVAAVPYEHQKTATLVAGLRVGGIVASLVIDHPMNGITFRAYVEHHLAPTLASGDIVICDTL